MYAHSHCARTLDDRRNEKYNLALRDSQNRCSPKRGWLHSHCSPRARQASPDSQDSPYGLALEIFWHWQFPQGVAASLDGHEKRVTAEMPRTGERAIHAM